MRYVILLVPLLALLALACNGGGEAQPTATAEPDATATAVPARFEESPCSRLLPEGLQEENARCGFVIVPEDRTKAEGPPIKLAVAVLRATGDDPAPDPLVFLSGGPGFPTLESALAWWQEVAAPIRSSRDLVFFDQRGTGRSEPALYCPEITENLLDNLAEALTPAEEATRHLDAALACRDRLRRMGVNLTAYTSAASAADIDDLMRALGYEEWNLYGVSYGSRLALTAMRDRPQGLRSVILDSAIPPQANWLAEIPRSYQRSLDLVFGACAADAKCNATFPDLPRVSLDLVATLNSSPVTVDVQDPTSGETRKVVITGDRLIAGTHLALYNTSTYPGIPFATYALSRGDHGILAAAVSGLLHAFQGRADGMAFSVDCSEEIPLLTSDIIAEVEKDVSPEIARALRLNLESELALCRAWGFRESDDRENEPVISDIPTLVLAGEWDPITPPSYGRLAAETLTRSYVFEFPATGHDVLSARPSCAVPIIEQFLDDPRAQPDGSCASQFGPPEYQLP